MRAAARRTRAGLIALACACCLPGTGAAQQEPTPARPPESTPAEAPPRNQTPPTVVAISVEGQKRYSQAQLVDALGQKIGAELDMRRIARGIENLSKAFHVRAEVKVRPVPGGVELMLVVEELPVDLEPRFVGNAEISTETLYKWAQLSDRGELYLYQADRVRQRLLEGYRQEGYAFAEVDVVKRGDESDTTSLPDVIFEIREGPQVRVSDVIVRGNHSLPDRGMWFWRDGLTKLARTDLSGPTLFNWYGSKYDEDKLEADLLAMREVYRDGGWLDAVVEAEPAEFSPDRSRVTIHVLVDEGQPWNVSTMAIRAFKREVDPQDREHTLDTPTELVYPEAELLALCSLKPGKRYKRVQQNQDSAALRKRYGKDGYLSHPSLGLDGWSFLDPELHYDFGKHEVSVTYRIAQGAQRYIREVLFEGARHTRDRVLRREVDVMPGQRADVEEISRSLNRLYSTNYFSDETSPLEHKDPTYEFKPVESQPSQVDLLYKVEEGRVVNLQLSGGVDSNNGAFGRISLEMRNFDAFNPPSSLWAMPGEIYDKEAFHGAGQRLVLDLAPGTQANAYQIRFAEPDLFRTHLDRTSLDLEVSLRTRDYSFYDEEKNTVRVRLGREFGRKWTVFAGFANIGIDITNLEAPLNGITQPDELPLAPSLFAMEGHSNLVGAQFDVNYRDLDRGLNPTEGVRVTWRNGLYGGVFPGDWDFIRSDIDADFFWPVGPAEDEVRPGFQLSLGAGVADDYAGTVDVPYTERFFLGGNHLLRGFAYRGVGPNQGGEPLGGETMLSASIEYRQPLYTVAQPGTYKKVEVFHAKLFVDAGILDPQPWTLDLNELRASVGFGFGLSYPIPISLNFGFPIQTGDGDQTERFSFNVASITF